MKTLLSLCLSLLFFTSFAQESQKAILPPFEFKQQVKKEKGVVLDVRTSEEYALAHLKKAKNIDFRNGDFANSLGQLDKTKTYYLYCASGNRSGKALQLMQEAGFTNVYNIGAYKDLKAAGLKVKEEKK